MRSSISLLPKQPHRCSIKNFTICTPVLESLFNTVADLQACNVNKERIQDRCFLVNIAKCFKIPILKIICEWLPLEVLCKDFVDISYENASFGILEHSLWLQLIYFLTTIAFWLMKYLFRFDGNKLSVLAKDFTLCIICC